MSLFQSLFRKTPSVSKEQIVAELASYWQALGTDEADKIEKVFLGRGPACIGMLQQVALDRQLSANTRKAALAIGDRIGGEAFATFMADHFVNGKNPGELYAAYQRGDANAGSEFGLFREAKDLLQNRGYVVKSAD